METERHKEEVVGSTAGLHMRTDNKNRDVLAPTTSLTLAIQIAKLEFLIARLRLVEALATRGRTNGGTRAILRHYLWLWDEVTPMPEGMYAHDIKEAFHQEHSCIDLTQFQYE